MTNDTQLEREAQFLFLCKNNALTSFPYQLHSPLIKFVHGELK